MRIVVELSDADRAFLARLWAEAVAVIPRAAPAFTADSAVQAEATTAAADETQRADGAPPAPPAAPEPGRKWSAERVAVVRRDWPTAIASIEILQRVNGLPGPEVTMHQLRTYAAVALHLRRPVLAPRISPTVPPIGSPMRPDGHSPRPAPVTPAQLETLERVPADFDTIYFWAGSHGIPSYNGSYRMLAEVNAKRLRVGLSPFQQVRRA